MSEQMVTFESLSFVMADPEPLESDPFADLTAERSSVLKYIVENGYDIHGGRLLKTIYRSQNVCWFYFI